MKAAAPTDQDCAQCRMTYNLQPDKPNGQPVVFAFKGIVRNRIHSHADNVDPSENGRAKKEKQEEKGNINSSCQVSRVTFQNCGPRSPLGL